MEKKDVPIVQVFGVNVEAVYDDEKTTAAITGDAVQTLRNNRFLGQGIPYCKVGGKGRSVRYFRPDTYRYMHERRISTEGR